MRSRRRWRRRLRRPRRCPRRLEESRRRRGLDASGCTRLARLAHDARSAPRGFSAPERPRHSVAFSARRLFACGPACDHITNPAPPLSRPEPSCWLMILISGIGRLRRSIDRNHQCLRAQPSTHGLAPDALARRCDRSVSWVSRRVNLVRTLPEAVQRHVQDGRLVAHAAMKCFVPLARANAADCVRLVDAIVPHRLSTRQIGRLYQAYVTGIDATRELVVTDPLLVLRVTDETAAAPICPEASAPDAVLIALPLSPHISLGCASPIPSRSRSRSESRTVLVVWVISQEQKWVNSRERRGRQPRSERVRCGRPRPARFSARLRVVRPP
jgi:hypothetical protein